MPEPEVGFVGGKLKKISSTTEKHTTTVFVHHPNQFGSLRNRFKGSTSVDLFRIMRRTDGMENEIIWRMMLDPIMALKATVDPK